MGYMEIISRPYYQCPKCPHRNHNATLMGAHVIRNHTRKILKWRALKCVACGKWFTKDIILFHYQVSHGHMGWRLPEKVTDINARIPNRTP